jgi:transposase
MRRREVLQRLRRMRFEDVYGRSKQRRLTQAEATEILGTSERTFRRWRDRYEGEGMAGLRDRRLGSASARRAPVDQVHRVLTLDRRRHGGFTTRHCRERLRQHHGFARGDTWTKLRLQAAGLVTKARAARRIARSGRGDP